MNALELGDVLRELNAGESADAHEEYRRLLSLEKLDGGQLKKLSSLMKSLGKTADGVKEDAQLLARVEGLQNHIEAGRGVDSGLCKSSLEVADSHAATRAGILQLEAKHAAVCNVNASLFNRRQAATGAIRDLNELRSSHKELLSHIPRQTDADLA